MTGESWTRAADRLADEIRDHLDEECAGLSQRSRQRVMRRVAEHAAHWHVVDSDENLFHHVDCGLIGIADPENIRSGKGTGRSWCFRCDPS